MSKVLATVGQRCAGGIGVGAKLTSIPEGTPMKLGWRPRSQLQQQGGATPSRERFRAVVGGRQDRDSCGRGRSKGASQLKRASADQG